MRSQLPSLSCQTNLLRLGEMDPDGHVTIPLQLLGEDLRKQVSGHHKTPHGDVTREHMEGDPLTGHVMSALQIRRNQQKYF